MVFEDEKGASSLNRVQTVLPDHISFIKSQMLKASGFISVSGSREVTIGNLERHVIIPSKDDNNYRKAWAEVYNLAIEYLENSLRLAYFEGGLDYRLIDWPVFEAGNANYARGLERILNEYNQSKKATKKEEPGIVVNQSSVMLEPVNQIHLVSDEDKESLSKHEDLKNNNLANQIHLVSDENKESLSKHEDLKNNNLANQIHLVSDEDKESLSKHEDLKNNNLANQSLSNFQSNDYSGLSVVETPAMSNPVFEEPQEEKTSIVSKGDFSAQKISDGDVLTPIDFSELRDSNTNLVILTCQNVDSGKEENIFLGNATHCSDENFKTGAFIYGKATDEHMVNDEVKKIVRLLENCGSNFTGFVIYSIDNSYALKNRDSEMKILSLINTYTAICDGLTQVGYRPMVSMNLTSDRIIGEVKQRYGLDDKYEVSYMVLVRELDDVAKEVSTTLVDPWNNYDNVTIKDTKFKNNEYLADKTNVHLKLIENKNLARAA
jgi:hypothetical protein